MVEHCALWIQRHRGTTADPNAHPGSVGAYQMTPQRNTTRPRTTALRALALVVAASAIVGATAGVAAADLQWDGSPSHGGDLDPGSVAAHESSGVRSQAITEFAFENRTVAQSENTTLRIRADREGHAVVLESPGLSDARLASLVPAAEQVGDVVVVSPLARDAELAVTPRCVPGGEYTVRAETADGNGSATANLTVEEPAEPDHRFDDVPETVVRGGVVEVGVEHDCDYDRNASGFVVSEAGTDEGYELAGSVPRNATAVFFNTYAAGHSHRANVSASDVVWATDANGTEVGVAIRNETALETLLPGATEYDLHLGVDVPDATRDPAAVGSLLVEERNASENSLALLRAPSNASLDSLDAIAAARANGSLTETGVVVPDRREQLVLEARVPGQSGAYRTVDGQSATARLRTLVERGSVELAVVQHGIGGNLPPRSVELPSSWSAVDVVEDWQNETVYVVIDLDAADYNRPHVAPLGTNHTEPYGVTYALTGSYWLGTPNTTPLWGEDPDPERYLWLEREVEFEAEDTSFLADPYGLPPGPDTHVGGSTNLAPGTPGRIVGTSTDAETPFEFAEPVDVGANGTFRASVDLENTTAGDAVALTARGGLAASTEGVVLGPNVTVPAHFDLRATAPDRVEEGRPATLGVVVENTGYSPGTARYTVSIAGLEVENRSLSLAAGENATATYEFDTDQSADVEWSVAVGGYDAERDTLAVGESAPANGSRAAPPDDASGGEQTATADEQREERRERSRFGLLVALAILVLGGAGTVFWLTSGDL